MIVMMISIAIILVVSLVMIMVTTGHSGDTFDDYFGAQHRCDYCCEDHDNLDSDNLGDLTGYENGDHHGDHDRNEVGDYLGGDCEYLNDDSLCF